MYGREGLLKANQTQDLSTKITSKLRENKEIKRYAKICGEGASKIVPVERRDPSIESSKRITHGITKVELVKPCKKKSKKRKSKSMSNILEQQSTAKPTRLAKRRSTGTLKIKRSRNFYKKMKPLRQKRTGKFNFSFKPISNMYTEEESGLDSIQSIFSNIAKTIEKEEPSGYGHKEEESGEDEGHMTSEMKKKKILHKLSNSRKNKPILLDTGTVHKQQLLDSLEKNEAKTKANVVFLAQSDSLESTLQLGLAQAFKNLYAAIDSVNDAVEKANLHATDELEPPLETESQRKSPKEISKTKPRVRRKIALKGPEAVKGQKSKKSSPLPPKVIKDRIILRTQGNDFIVRGYNCLQTFSQLISIVNKLCREGCTADITSSLMPFLLHNNVRD